MKTFSKQLQIQNTQATPEIVNVNVKEAINQINGNLDSSNLPVNHLVYSSFTPSIRVVTSTATARKLEYNGATQQYRHASRYNDEFGTTWAPLATLDLSTDDWSKGWNNLIDFSTFQDIQLNFNSKEGMLNGCADVDFCHGINIIPDGTPPSLTGYNWWTRWGVFLNGSLIAETGEMAPGRKNVIIPFAVPCGSQNIQIELKWQSITTHALNSPTYTPDPSTLMEMYGARVWCRNTYK